MINKVKNFIDKQSLLPNNPRVLVAVSGGADSLALMHILHQLKYNCVIAHINHNLRASQSDKDEKFVIQLCKTLNLEYAVHAVDVKACADKNKISIETAARKLRIKNLIQIAKQKHCDLIATAHHGDDDVETVLHRIMRGTGYRGLAGIRAKNIIEGFRFVRPLLIFTRKDIENFLQNRNINWRQDHTNSQTRFTRNWIRHKLIPYLEKNSNADITKKIRNLSRSCEKLQNNIEQKARAVFNNSAKTEKNKIVFNLEKFNNFPTPIRHELLTIAVETLKIGQQKMTFTKYRNIINAAEKKTGSVNLPKHAKAKLSQNKLIIQKNITRKNESLKLEPGQTVTFNDLRISATLLEKNSFSLEDFINRKDKNTEWFDADKINPPLTIRNIQKGDKFIALGKNSPRKPGDYTRDKTRPVITDNKTILWIVGIRRCQPCKVSENTKRILQLKCSEKHTYND